MLPDPSLGGKAIAERFRKEREIIFENAHFLIDSGGISETEVANRVGKTVNALRALARRYDRSLHDKLLTLAKDDDRWQL